MRSFNYIYLWGRGQIARSFGGLLAERRHFNQPRDWAYNLYFLPTKPPADLYAGW